MPSRLWLLLAVLLPAACKSNEPGTKSQLYRGEIDSGLGDTVPFVFRLPARGSAEPIVFYNGAEQTPAEHELSEKGLRVRFPNFGSEIRATFTGGGKMEGSFQTSQILSSEFKFRATPIQDRKEPRVPPHLFESGGKRKNFGGTWTLDIAHRGLARAMLEQNEDGRVVGTGHPTWDSDWRFMEGDVSGDELIMSGFNGQAVYVIRAQLDDDERMTGKGWLWPNLMSITFTGTRGDRVPMQYFDRIKLMKGVERITFPPLDDPKLAGKPVILDIFGTWCPACLDATPVLHELYERHKDGGLEMLGLAVELTKDEAYAAKQVELYRKKFGVPWPISLGLSDPEDIEDAIPEEIEGYQALPLILFINRDHTVRSILNSVPGRATGSEHERIKKEIERMTQEILASPAPAAP
jgi:thiol-disulfide isomerase/thioredoxin